MEVISTMWGHHEDQGRGSGAAKVVTVMPALSSVSPSGGSAFFTSRSTSRFKAREQP